MPDGKDHRLPHFLLEGVTKTEPYKSPLRVGRAPSIPARDRQSHGAALLGAVEQLRVTAASLRDEERAADLEEALGLNVEFVSFPDIELAFESLARERSGIELLNVRHSDKATFATVFVPDGKLTQFERLITDYLEAKHDRAGRPRDNRRLIDAIRAIRAAGIRALWTDDPLLFPESDKEFFWWEVWLPVRGNREGAVADFKKLAKAHGAEVAPEQLVFPERTVVLAYASKEQLQRSTLTLNTIAELRRAKETAQFFDELPSEQHSEWLDDLLSRTEYAEPGNDQVHICLLDTGVNRGHPLLSPALETSDLHTVEPAWGTDDQNGHGTMMAGLALAGDLTEWLEGGGALSIGHRLESVKLLEHDGGNAGNPLHHGYLTTEAIARPEVTAADRRRVFGMAISARDARDRGRPTAWSAAIDRLAADAAGYGANPRLLIISAGNIQDSNAWALYPDSNDTDSIHDPGQAWNALTVGASTELVNITESDTEDFAPIAALGGLSPFSTTSVTWQPHWPLKPDCCFEGGNAARDSLSAVWFPSLSLLTTHHRPQERLFTTINATSAATALAARMAAEIMQKYPTLWPETVRALIVQSAEWTAQMRKSYLPATGTASKADYRKLIRRCGFGVPDLDRAMWSVSNSLTMVVQEELYPFGAVQGGQPKLRDMQLHELPWPKQVLEDLGPTPVEMRVTLSYFIEPNPSSRGVRSRYRYESHGLRFDVKRPYETLTAFRSRINVAARDEEEGTHSTDADSDWLVGKQNRHRGSLHSDIWRGTAADLASREVLAVYPALGWWKTRPRLERYDRPARYALIVSITAPEVDVDLYTEVANQVGIPIKVEI